MADKVKSFEYLGLGSPKKREKVIKVHEHYLLPTIDIELDKETGNTTAVKTGTRDIYEEIQACKDQSGFEAMYQKLQSGKAVPADFADDGKHSADVSDVPDNINDAYRREMEAQIAAEQAKRKLGLEGDIPVDKIEEIVNAKVQEIMNSYAPKKEEVKNDEAK